jgi:WD40 repeat protein
MRNGKRGERRARIPESRFEAMTTASRAPAKGNVPTRENEPYVGPRALREEDRLFGREEEVLELVDMTIADRIVLLHSPSGAGKTSLLQAGLIPRLRVKGFRVPAKPIRLSLTPPEGARANRYIYSLLASLDESLSDERLVELSDPSKPGLGKFCKERFKTLEAASESKQELWVLDQFEEVLTLEQHDGEAKELFFSELGKVLRDERCLWAIFAIREDYLGELSPLAVRIPTRLSNLYRLTLLGPREAAAAIMGPAEEAGVQFEEAAAQQLVDNLRKIHDKSTEGPPEVGPFVEPLQLQVVCLWLWEKLAEAAAAGTDPDPSRITVDDLKIGGDVVDDALAGYYSTRVALVAEKTSAGFSVPAQSERKIREWFSYRLINAKGVRQPVSKEQNDLPEPAVSQLRDAYLVREDRRGSFTWIELAHDRLIAPVTRCNDDWFEDRLSPFQIRTALWNCQGRPDRLLLSGPDLNGAERWAAAHPDELDSDGRALLSRSKQELTGKDAVAYQVVKHMLWFVTGLAAVLAIHAVVLGLLLWGRSSQNTLLKRQKADLEKRETELKDSSAKIKDQNDQIQAQLKDEIKIAVRLEDSGARARIGQIASRSLLLLPEQPDVSMLLGVEGVRRVIERDGKSYSASVFDPTWGRTRVVAFNALLSALKHMPEATAYFSPSGGEIAAVALRADGRRAATVDQAGSLMVTDLVERRSVLGPVPLQKKVRGAVSVTYSANGKSIASGGGGGTVVVIDGETGKERRRFETAQPVGTTVFRGGDAEVVFAAGRSVFRGSVENGDSSEITHCNGQIYELALSADGKQVAFAESLIGRPGRITTLRIWDIGSPKQIADVRMETGVNITALAYCPLYPRLVAVATSGEQAQQQGRAAATDSVTYHIQIRDVATGQRVGLPLVGHAGVITSLAFGRDGATLASSGADRSVLIWDLKGELDAARNEGKGVSTDARGRMSPIDAATGRPLARRLDGHRGPVQGVAFASDGHTFVSAGLDGLLILWDLNRTRRLARPVPGYEVADGMALNLAVSSNGTELAIGSMELSSQLRFHDFKTGKTFDRPQTKLDSLGYVNLGYSFDGQQFYATATNQRNTTQFWKTSDWSPLPFSLSQDDEVTQLSLSPDGGWLAGIHNFNFLTGATVWTWDPTARALAAKVKIPNPKSGPWRALAFSRDGGTLALGDSSGGVVLFRSGESRPLRVRRLHQGAVGSLAFDPFGRMLASGGDDNAVVFWDLQNPDAPVESQSVHRGPVGCLAFDPFGMMLASGGDDGAIVFWDGRTGLPLGPAFAAHTGGVSTLAFAPDGKRLFSSGKAGGILTWDADPDAWLKMARSVANRGFTEREWNENFGDENRSLAQRVAWEASTGLPWVNSEAPGVSATDSTGGERRVPDDERVMSSERRSRGPALKLASRWMPGQTITIGFRDGSEPDHARVRRWAEEWTRKANLRFVWTSAAGAMIRITFEGSDNWTYLGSSCLVAPQGEPTMGLGVTKTQDEKEARRTVLFEFGHALGFIDELQKPDLGFVWNTQAVLDDLRAAYDWPPNKVYQRVLMSYPKEALDLNTTLDPDSIMMPGLKASWTLEGKAMNANYDLSDGDKAAARAAYPPGPDVKLEIPGANVR